MIRYLSSLVLTLTMAMSGFCHEVDVPTQVGEGELIVARAKGEHDAKGFVWLIIDPKGAMLINPKVVFKDSRIPDTVAVAGGNGLYQFMLITSNADGSLEQSFGSCVRGTSPGPGPGPTPSPGPDPGPVPTPVPDPDNASVGPLSLLIVYEVSDKLAPEQEAIISGPKISSYMKTHAAKDATGQIEWRNWDDDYTEAQLANAPPKFKDIYLKTKPKWEKEGIPYFVLSNGKRGIEGKLPSEKEFEALLKAYGGN